MDMSEMNNEQVPEREIWIEPGQDRDTRYWQPIVFQGGVRYILASTVAAQLAEKDAEQRKLIQYFEGRLAESATVNFRLRANHQSQLAELRLKYRQIFTITSTGDPAHPAQGGIDYDAKADFETALEAARDQPMSKGDTDAKFD